MSFQGHVEKGIVVLDQPLPLPDGTPVVVEPVRGISADFWQSRSLNDLARHQGVMPPRSIQDYLGGWPADEIDDGFEEALRRWRDAELEPRS